MQSNNIHITFLVSFFILFLPILSYSKNCVKEKEKLICFDGYYQNNNIKFKDMDTLYVHKNDPLVTQKIDESNYYSKEFFFKKWVYYSLNKKIIYLIHLKYFKNSELNSEIYFSSLPKDGDYLQLKKINWYVGEKIIQKNLYFNNHSKDIYTHKIFIYNNLQILINTSETFFNKKNHKILDNKTVFFFISN